MMTSWAPDPESANQARAGIFNHVNERIPQNQEPFDLVITDVVKIYLLGFVSSTSTQTRHYCIQWLKVDIVHCLLCSKKWINCNLSAAASDRALQPDWPWIFCEELLRVVATKRLLFLFVFLLAPARAGRHWNLFDSGSKTFRTWPCSYHWCNLSNRALRLRAAPKKQRAPWNYTILHGARPYLYIYILI